MLLATLVELTIESIVCGVYGTFAIPTLLKERWFNCFFFCIHMIAWMLIDFFSIISSYKLLSILALRYLTAKSIQDEILSYIWLWRGILAVPIWIIALMGQEINWRKKAF